MEAERALADLVEISPQIEAAAVVTGWRRAGRLGRRPRGPGDVLARAVRELLEGAAAFRRDEGRVTQLHAELAGGDVFAVTGGTSGRSSPSPRGRGRPASSSTT